MEDASLSGLAGRFVWLEMDYDKPVNQPFMQQRAVRYTPSLYVLDPADERATATHLGGMTLAELRRFLDDGERGFHARAQSPADVALAHGDECLGRSRLADAAAAYRKALALAPSDWPKRAQTVGSLTWSLWVDGQLEACTKMAVAEAPRMERDEAFARVVLAGFSSSLQGGDAAWAPGARDTLEPLAEEAIALPSVLRDHRFQLYEQVMSCAQARGDSTSARRWSLRWLDEIDAITPGNDNERSALDIARVDAVVDDRELPRVIPALAASERAMPNNYNASLRLAQMELEARHYDEAIAACDRGLAHVTGPVGRCWLQRTKAEALSGQGDKAAARQCLEHALESARAIGNPSNRDHNIQRIMQEIEELNTPGK